MKKIILWLLFTITLFISLIALRNTLLMIYYAVTAHITAIYTLGFIMGNAIFTLFISALCLYFFTSARRNK